MALTKIKETGIADDAVTAGKIAAGAVVADITTGSVTATHLAGSIPLSKTNLTAGNGISIATDTVSVSSTLGHVTGVGTLATAHIQGGQAYASSATSLSTTVSKKALRVQGSSDASVSLWMGSLANDAQQYIQACNDAGNGADDIVLNPFGGKVGIGIGNASPSTGLHLSGGDNTASKLTLTNTAPSPDNSWSLHPEYNSQNLTLSEDSTTRVTFASGGYFGIGKTTDGLSANGGFWHLSGENSYNEFVRTTTSDSSANLYISRANNGLPLWFGFIGASPMSVGSVSITNSATSFNTTSDYRIKENEIELPNALSRVNNLKPYRFNFISDADNTVDGFFAHEVAEVVPEAVTGEKDAVDDDGEIKPQQLDHSKLVPILVKAVQELSAKVEELEKN